MAKKIKLLSIIVVIVLISSCKKTLPNDTYPTVSSWTVEGTTCMEAIASGVYKNKVLIAFDSIGNFAQIALHIRPTKKKVSMNGVLVEK